MEAIRSYVVLAVLAVLAVGCSQSNFGNPTGDLPPPLDGPGQQDWSSTNVTCQTDADCALHESCIDNVCQMARCKDGPYKSNAPIGPSHIFYNDKEILAIDSNAYQSQYWVDGYSPQTSSIQYASASWPFGGSQIVDVAGGNVEGTRPESAVVAVSGQTGVDVWNSGQVQHLSFGFQPIAVATGDVDGDSIDDIIALSADGQFALCNATTSHCDSWAFTGSVQGIDVTAADVDGDGYAEPVFLIKSSGTTQLVVWNTNHKQTGETELLAYNPGTDYLAIDAGDLDGDGKAEIVALEDGGWLGLASDHLQIWDWTPSQLTQVGDVSVDSSSKDVAVADFNMDQHDEVTVLHDTNSVTVYTNNGGPGSLTEAYAGTLSATGSPTRIGTADIDGDSPIATLLSGPKLVAGAAVPTMVLNFPPYDKQHSKDPAYLFVGDTMNETSAYTDSVSLSVGFEVGVQAGLEGVFDASVKAQLTQALTVSSTFAKTTVIGDRFSITPQPDLHGPSYGVVVLSSGCFNTYTYQLDDPTGRLGQGANGGKFLVAVPVGGQSTVWSSTRYNAMAKAVGNLPQVQVSEQLGDPKSYPSTPTHPDGTPVPAADMLFPQPPKYLVSDVGTVGWWLAVASSQTNQVDMTQSVGVSSSITAAGFTFGSNITAGTGKGYAITVGKEALFGGGVPAIPDDPNTAEDEYKAFAFSFSPYAYLQHYKDGSGQDESYYVLDFTVGQP